MKPQNKRKILAVIGLIVGLYLIASVWSNPNNRVGERAGMEKPEPRTIPETIRLSLSVITSILLIEFGIILFMFNNKTDLEKQKNFLSLKSPLNATM